MTTAAAIQDPAEIAPQDPPVDLTQPQPPKTHEAENETDHQIRLMIARRKPTGDPAVAKPQNPAPVPVTEPAQSAEPTPDVGDLLAGALKFRPAKKAAVVEKPKDIPKEEKATTEAPKEEPKTVVRKRAQPVAIDPVKVATAAATAATAEAVKAFGKKEAAAPDAAQDLSEPDRLEYEVVQFMASTDPRFKGADQTFLANVKKAEKYAESWETRNPGKLFNPEDDEHNEFFGSIKQPYSPQELRRAEARMEARSETAKATAKQDEKTRDQLRNLESENARLKLAPQITSTLQQTIQHMATSLGDDVVASLRAGGPKKLQEDDPIADGELTAAIKSVSPIVQAIVEIEFSDGQVEYNDRNPAHVAYANLLAQKEADFAGVDDGQGRTCVSRAEYQQMSPAQRNSHFFLTPQNIIAELASDEVEATKGRIESERNRVKKIAERMGYAPKAATNGSGGATVATTPKKDPPKELGSTTAIKPASPASSTGAKIDVKDPTPSTQTDVILEKVGGILFGR